MNKKKKEISKGDIIDVLLSIYKNIKPERKFVHMTGKKGAINAYIALEKLIHPNKDFIEFRKELEDTMEEGCYKINNNPIENYITKIS